MKIVINKRYGGFGLSNAALKTYLAFKNKECYFYESISNGDYRLLKDNDPKYKSCFQMVSTEYLGETVERKNFPHETYFSSNKIERTDPDLIKTIELLGKKANGPYSDLKIVEIPDDIKYTIEEYDGVEWVAEEHRTWS